MGKQKGKRNRCPVSWNPGYWPYATICANTKGHKGDHDNGKGSTIPNLGPEQEDQCSPSTR